MKKGFLIIFIFIFSYSIYPDNASFLLPEKLILFNEVDISMIEPAAIYPFGWSREGNFAYIIAPPVEALGHNIYRFVIQNMITDKIVYDFWLGGWNGSTGDTDEYPPLKELWEKDKEICIKKLIEYGIFQQRTIELKSFPIEKDGDYINFKLLVTFNESDNEYYNITDYELLITSKNLGSKTIDTDKVQALSAGILGYIKSPYEDRIAVFLMTVIHGWEGPPNPVHLKLIGCHLTRGFEK